MMEMLERIARKLCKLEHPDMLDDWHDRAWPEWCEDASAVIADMREPTEAMRRAAEATGVWRDYEGDAVGEAWSAMIHAAAREMG